MNIRVVMLLMEFPTALENPLSLYYLQSLSFDMPPVTYRVQYSSLKRLPA